MTENILNTQKFDRSTCHRRSISSEYWPSAHLGWDRGRRISGAVDWLAKYLKGRTTGIAEDLRTSLQSVEFLGELMDANTKGWL